MFPWMRSFCNWRWKHNLAVYDATYLSLTETRRLPLAAVDGKLQQAAQSLGIQVLRP
jgi:predicted nucleic acid-binding protein